MGGLCSTTAIIGQGCRRAQASARSCAAHAVHVPVAEVQGDAVGRTKGEGRENTSHAGAPTPCMRASTGIAAPLFQRLSLLLVFNDTTSLLPTWSREVSAAIMICEWAASRRCIAASLFLFSLIFLR